MEMKILYIIPKNKFFYKGLTGSVSHVIGLTSALNKNYELDISANDLSTLNEEIRCSKVVSNSLFYLFRHINRYDVVIVRYSISKVIYLFVLRGIAKHKGVRVVLEVNSLYGNTTKILCSSVFKIVEKPLIKRYEYLHVVSSAMKKWLIERNINNSFYVPNGHYIKDDIACTIVKTKVQSLVYIGSYKDYYNFDQMNRFSIENEVSINVYGSDNISSFSSLTFKGMFRFESARKLVFQGNALILPYKSGTLAEIGFPIKLCEYLAMKTPIVSTRTGVLKTILGGVDEKLMYEDGDDQSLWSAFIYAQNMSVNEKQNLYEKYEKLKNRLDWDNLVHLIVEARDYE